ncbi:MAG: formate acetyltransferase, partial [Clostridia bacterium]|nr:formate acetyltransferase [Clostridia bacterium]
MQHENWLGFNSGVWQDEINVRDFIQKNYKEYAGDASFLASATPRTNALMEKVNELFRLERQRGGVLDVDTDTVSSLTSYAPGYIDKENELIFGMQTDSPLKRGVNPFGGIRMARQACAAYGYRLSDKVEDEFKFRTTHNDGVFRVYTDEMRKARKCHIITGLPDAYGRGRIIGDYRRVALYGVDKLIEEKQKDKKALAEKDYTVDSARLSEELYQQIAFLGYMKEMAAMYGFDISAPAKDAKEAVQWTYFAYLGAIKEQNGAAMSLGRVSSFFDIYIERDIERGILTEETAQELIDDFVIKLRIARHLRTPEYNELFGGDPMWITEAVGGMGNDGRTLVTKSSFRMLNTLYTLGSSPEPNLTVLWSARLPEGFKKFCAKVSADTDSIQYENDDVMRPLHGDDYAIACCVSAMEVGKQMQFFGARCNLAKLLLIALNGGFDTTSGIHIGPQMDIMDADILDYDKVMERYHIYVEWLSKLYVNTMNLIHYMHDKYAYEKTQMALHDTDVQRLMAFGVAGLSVVADSLSAIKHASVHPIKDEMGYIVDFKTEGDFPKYGNDDDRVDKIAYNIVHMFMEHIRKNHTYRDSIPTTSILTIT